MNINQDKNPTAPTIHLQDIIDEQLTKTQAILDCLLAAGDSQIELDNETIFNAIWSVHDNLREVIACRTALTELKNENASKEKMK